MHVSTQPNTVEVVVVTSSVSPTPECYKWGRVARNTQNAAARDACNRGHVAHITQRHARKMRNEAKAKTSATATTYRPQWEIAAR